jgi:ribonuclease-3 family protein
LAKRYVSAKAQAEFYYLIEPQLSEEELGVMRRGRNVNPKTKAKNASVTEYRHATGFETLMGYLYLKGNTARIEEIFEKCIFRVNGDTNGK